MLLDTLREKQLYTHVWFIPISLTSYQHVLIKLTASGEDNGFAQLIEMKCLFRQTFHGCPMSSLLNGINIP